MDGSGNAYVTGSTSSLNFPTKNPFQPNYGGGGYDAFVTKISSAAPLMAASSAPAMDNATAIPLTVPHVKSLLTVVMHELGHLLVYAHADDGVMCETLASGTRAMPAGESDLSLLDGLFENTHDQWLLWETWI